MITTFDTTTITPGRASPVTRIARTLAIGLVAFGISAAALPAVASAHGGAWGRPQAISQEIDRIAYQVREVAKIRSPYRQDRRIDQLQSRLARLEAITGHQRGRLARQNDRRIDRLQAWLRRMEWHAERRIGWRGDYRQPTHYRYHR